MVGNANGLKVSGVLVIVGAIAYVLVGGPLLLAGGIAVGLALMAWHRRESGHFDGEGPTRLFGAQTTREEQQPPRPGNQHLRLIPATSAPLPVIRDITPGRGIPAGGVARRSNIPDILAPRALPAAHAMRSRDITSETVPERYSFLGAGRIAALGAYADFRNEALVSRPGEIRAMLSSWGNMGLGR